MLAVGWGAGILCVSWFPPRLLGLHSMERGYVGGDAGKSKDGNACITSIFIECSPRITCALWQVVDAHRIVCRQATKDVAAGRIPRHSEKFTRNAGVCEPAKFSHSSLHCRS